MKADIHPTWYNDAKVTCACGNVFNTGSTQETIRVEICSNCHPFYTGTQKFVDTLGQVERFQKRTEEAKAKKQERDQIVEARKARSMDKKSDKPSLRDLLLQARKSVAS